MSRAVKLNKEQVWVIQNDAKKLSLKEYAAEFGVSYSTIYNAKKGKPPYDKEIAVGVENNLVEKYFAGTDV